MIIAIGKKMISAIIIAALMLCVAPFVAMAAADDGSDDKSKKVTCVEISDENVSVRDKKSGENVSDVNMKEIEKKGIKEIPDNEVPLAGVDNYIRTVSHWSLIDLIATVATVMIALMMFVLRYNDDEFDYRGKAVKLGTTALAAVSVIILSTTQNFCASMIIADVYSIPLVALLVLSVAVTIFTYSNVSVQRR